MDHGDQGAIEDTVAEDNSVLFLINSLPRCRIAVKSTPIT